MRKIFYTRTLHSSKHQQNNVALHYAFKFSRFKNLLNLVNLSEMCVEQNEV